MEVLTTLTDSMTAQPNSIQLGILKFTYFTSMLKATYKEKLKLHTYFEVSKEYFID